MFFKLIFEELYAANIAGLSAVVFIFMLGNFIYVIQKGAGGALFDVASAVAEVRRHFGFGNGFEAVFAFFSGF